MSLVGRDSDVGGYAPDFFKQNSKWSAHSAAAIVPLLMELLKPSSVVDVGCGVGDWLAEFRRAGVDDLLGIDGPWVPLGNLQIPVGSFVEHDLSQPFQLDRSFDMALCLEVGEHLPGSSADVLVELLTSLAPAVVFSAAIPGQGGVHHINEQWPEYWAERFFRCGYEVMDCLRPRIWANAGIDSWYAQNMLLYATPEFTIAHSIAVMPPPLSVVHPRLWEAATAARDLNNVSLTRLMRALPTIVKRAARRHLPLP